MELGITPAWAGKSLRHQCREYMAQDHPRMGGEKAASLAGLTSGVGSPPRGRGKAIWGPSSLWRVRITPAWAGKRAARGGSSSSSWDHPRTGGEKNTTTRHRTSLLGSPPRGRGKGVAVAGVPVAAGITPAQAGKRRETSDRRNASRDHPRVGGEKFCSKH